MTRPQYPIAYVEWLDAKAATDGWEDREAVVRDAAEGLVKPCFAAGFLIYDDEAGIVLAGAINAEHDDVMGGIAIPRAAIVRLDVWSPA